MVINHMVFKSAKPLHEIFSDTERWLFGTCEGLWIIEDERILISAIKNNEPHNGHFALFMKRIEKTAIKANKDLYFISFINQRFKEHLKKCGYVETVVTVKKDGEITDGVMKQFRGKL